MELFISFITICIASFVTGMFLAERKARMHWEELHEQMKISRGEFAERNIKYLDEIDVLRKSLAVKTFQYEAYKARYDHIKPNCTVLLADPSKDELRILRNAFHPDKHQGKHHDLWVQINDLYENSKD